jgi:hypothetical protein
MRTSKNFTSKVSDAKKRLNRLLLSLDKDERLAVVGCSLALNDLERRYGKHALKLAAAKYLAEK